MWEYLARNFSEGYKCKYFSLRKLAPWRNVTINRTFNIQGTSSPAWTLTLCISVCKTSVVHIRPFAVASRQYIRLSNDFDRWGKVELVKQAIAGLSYHSPSFDNLENNSLILNSVMRMRKYTSARFNFKSLLQYFYTTRGPQDHVTITYTAQPTYHNRVCVWQIRR